MSLRGNRFGPQWHLPVLSTESKAGKSVYRASIATSEGGRNGGPHSCATGSDNGTTLGTHRPDPGSFDAAEIGGTGANYHSRNRWRRCWRDSAAPSHMAQDGQHVAQTLAGCGRDEEHGGTFERCAPLRGAGQVHTGAGLRDHRLGLRRPQGQRSTHQSMEPERGGPASGQVRHRAFHFARLGGTLFKRVSA